jgi:hypothetical protein
VQKNKAAIVVSVTNPIDVGDGFDITYSTHYPRQVATAVYMNHQTDNSKPGILLFHVNPFNIAVRHGHCVRQFGNNATLALKLYPQLYGKFIGNVLGPFKLGQVGAGLITFRQP